MRLFLFLLLSVPAFGAGLSVVKDASSTAIPTGFGSAGGTVFSNIRNQDKLCYKNDTSVGIYLCYEVDTAANCENDAYVAPNTGMCFDFGPFMALFHKSSGSAISSGIITAKAGR